MAKKIKKFKDIEAEAKAELQEENIAAKKELLKERIREINDAQDVLNQLEQQYQDLLDKAI